MTLHAKTFAAGEREAERKWMDERIADMNAKTTIPKQAVELLPCPFCGSKNIDPEGWASTERAGPACDDCAGTADTVELWNSRPVVGVQRPEDVARALWIAGRTGRTNDDWELELATSPNALEMQTAFRQAAAVLALPHTGQPQEGWQIVPKMLSTDMMRAAINAWIEQGRKPGDIWGSEIGDMWRAMLSAAPASPRAEGE